MSTRTLIDFLILLGFLIFPPLVFSRGSLEFQPGPVQLPYDGGEFTFPLPQKYFPSRGIISSNFSSSAFVSSFGRTKRGHKSSGCSANLLKFNKNFVLKDRDVIKDEKTKDVYVYKEIVAPGSKLKDISTKDPKIKEQMKLDVVQFQVRRGEARNLSPVKKFELKEARETLIQWDKEGAKVPSSGKGFNSDKESGFRLDLQGTVNRRGEKFYNIQLQKNTKGGARGPSVAHVQIPVSLFDAKKGSSTGDLGGSNYLASSLRKSLETGSPVYVQSFTETVKQHEARSKVPGSRTPVQP